MIRAGDSSNIDDSIEVIGLSADEQNVSERIHRAVARAAIAERLRGIVNAVERWHAVARAARGRTHPCARARVRALRPP
jgi:hypothetical protein